MFSSGCPQFGGYASTFLMNQVGPRAVQAAEQNSGYQQYMSKYAGDYQKYMQGQGKGAQGGAQGGYDKYMSQYAGDYQKYMQGQGSKGGDYQKYMDGYASQYTGGRKPDSQRPAAEVLLAAGAASGAKDKDASEKPASADEQCLGLFGCRVCCCHDEQLEPFQDVLRTQPDQ